MVEGRKATLCGKCMSKNLFSAGIIIVIASRMHGLASHLASALVNL